jgi:hypothetical protein
MGETRHACKIFVGRPEEERPYGRPRHMWADNIKTHLKEIWWGGVEWIHLAQYWVKWRVLTIKGGFLDQLSNY